MTYKTSSDSPTGAIDDTLLATYLSDIQFAPEEELFLFLQTNTFAKDLFEGVFAKNTYFNLMVSSHRVLAIAKDKTGKISQREFLLEQINNAETIKGFMTDTIQFFLIDSTEQIVKYDFINNVAPFKREYLPLVVTYFKKLKGGFVVNDVDQAIDKIPDRVGFGGVKEKIKQYLIKDEQIIKALIANVGINSSGEKLKVKALEFSNKKPGIFVITSNRVFHVSKVLWKVEFEQISLDQIDSVEFKAGIIFANIRIYGRNNIMEIDMSKPDAEAYARLINNAMESYKHPTATVPTATQPDPLAQIQKLAELKEQGILSEEEFNEKKKQLLARL
ncbi:MAG TPA: PH domain-containing protein [Leptospiraceae bacterium]|nr:PH domain-containing protein [Leptospiraceae bacterium]